MKLIVLYETKAYTWSNCSLVRRVIKPGSFPGTVVCRKQQRVSAILSVGLDCVRGTQTKWSRWTKDTLSVDYSLCTYIPVHRSSLYVPKGKLFEWLMRPVRKSCSKTILNHWDTGFAIWQAYQRVKNLIYVTISFGDEPTINLKFDNQTPMINGVQLSEHLLTVWTLVCLKSAVLCCPNERYCYRELVVFTTVYNINTPPRTVRHLLSAPYHTSPYMLEQRQATYGTCATQADFQQHLHCLGLGSSAF